MVETGEEGDEDEGNSIRRESENAETMNPTVQDQGNAVGGNDSTAETTNPAEEVQGNSVGNGQPIAETMTPAASSSREQPQSTLARIFDYIATGTGNLAKRFARQPEPYPEQQHVKNLHPLPSVAARLHPPSRQPPATST